MKTIMKFVLVLSIILILTGIFGSVYNRDQTFRGMMYDRYGDDNRSDEKISIDKLEQKVNEYISSFEQKLVIDDIFIYEDTDYYFSIIEEETGLGAMELLVDPYTGVVYPEYGPNMMWNLKYGMHNKSGYGMMGARGMMGRAAYNRYAERNDITLESASQIAKEYLNKEFSDGHDISIEAHEFYGYYTFHIENVDTTIGMMSVNGFTGKVWYHDWHGNLLQVLGDHS